MSAPLIAARALSCRYPHTSTPVLRHLDFRIDAGEFVVLAGASGSGKSTLCRLLNGLIPRLYPSEVLGELTVAGADPRYTASQQLNRIIGMVLQRPDVQCLGSTVARDIAFAPACHGLERAVIMQRVAEELERLQVGHLRDRAPHQLSCGEQQRVALAGVLAVRPSLLVLDEPFAFLDWSGAAQLRQLLRALHEAGITLVVAEHRLGELLDLASRMLILHAGELVADGTPAKLLKENLSAWGLEAPPTSAAPILPVVSTNAADAVLAWENIAYRRAERWVLRDASLAVAAGQCVALFGRNGAGKTTLLRHGNGLLRAERGTVRVLGEALGQRPVAELAKTVGLVFQQPTQMLFAATVSAELAAGARALHRYDRAWCARLSESFALTHLLERPPHTLSAGEQRRVAIAAVLAARPKVLLLDEPSAGQDAVARTNLRTMLSTCADDGLAIVIATHDQHWAASFCHAQALLAQGQVQSSASPSRAALPVPTVANIPALPADSDPHNAARRFDPRAELTVYLIYCLTIFLTLQPAQLLPLLALPVIGIARQGCWSAWGRALRVLLPTLLLFLLIVSWSGGFVAAGGAVLRLLALVSASVLFFARVSAEQLGDALLASGLAAPAVFLLEGTLRFIPSLGLLLREVRDAQTSRGFRLDGFALVRNGITLLIPLLMSVMRLADDLSEALEVRGFTEAARTPLVAYRLQSRDWLLIAGAVLASTAMLLLL